MAETLKKWEEIGRSYRVYIKLEKRLSENTVESYMRDLRQFAHFMHPSVLIWSLWQRVERGRGFSCDVSPRAHD